MRSRGKGLAQNLARGKPSINAAGIWKTNVAVTGPTLHGRPASQSLYSIYNTRQQLAQHSAGTEGLNTCGRGGRAFSHGGPSSIFRGQRRTVGVWSAPLRPHTLS